MAKKTLATMNANHSMKMASKVPVYYCSAPRKGVARDDVLWVTTILNKETQQTEVGQSHAMDYYSMSSRLLPTNVLDTLADGFTCKFTTSDKFQFDALWQLENRLHHAIADRSKPHFKSFFRMKEKIVRGRRVSELELYVKPLDPA